MPQDQTQMNWPNQSAVLAVYDTRAACSAALQDVDAAAMFRVARRMPSEIQSRLARPLGIQRVAKVNQGLVGRLLERVRGTGDPAALSDFVATGIYSFHASQEDHAAWTAALAGEPNDIHFHNSKEGDTLSLAEWIATVESGLGAEFEKVCLIAAVALGDNPVAALTFLAAIDEDAADAHAQLRNDWPEMPPVGVGFYEYGRLDPWHDDEVDSADPAAAAAADDVDTGDVDAAEHELPVDDARSLPDVPGTGHAELDALTRGVVSLDWEAAANVASQVLDDVESRRSPGREDVDFLRDFAENVHTLAEQLGQMAGRPVEPDADSLAQAHTEFAAALQHRSASDATLRALTLLTGPSQLHGPLTVIRDLAADALAADVAEPVLEALRAFHDLAQAGAARKSGADVDFTEINGYDTAARAGLPTAAHPALSAAMLGDIVVASAAAPVDVEGAEVTAPDAAAQAAQVGEKVDAQEPSDVSATEPRYEPAPSEQEPDPEPAESQDVGEPDREQAPEPAPVIEPEPALDETSSDVDEEDAQASDALTGTGVDEASLLASLRSTLGTSAAGSLRTAPAAPPTPDPETAADATVADAEPTPAAGDDAADSGAAILDAARGAEAALLNSARFGLAAELHREPAHHSARAMAAYQQYLTSPAGPLAAAFAEAAAGITREQLADDRPGQLLAWASAVRVAVVAPAVGAAAVLTSLAPCVQDNAALTAVGNAFTTAALAGAFVVPEAAQALSVVQAADTTAEEAAEKAAAMVAGAPQRNIKYTPANGVYQSWMNPGKDIGDLLRLVARNDATATTAVLEKVTALRGGADRHIDDSFANRKSSQKNRKIIGGARSTLVSLYNDALDTASTWAENTAAAVEHRSHWAPDDRNTRPLDNLRHDLASVKHDALDELDAMGAGFASSDPRVAAEAAAARQASVMLQTAFAISDGKPPTGIEPSPQYVLRGELLATDLILDPVSLEPVEADSDEQTRAIILLADTTPEVSTTYEHRARRGEHDLTAVLTANLNAVSPEDAATLTDLRNTDVHTLLEGLTEQLARTEALIRVNQRDATLPSDTATALAAQVEAIRDSSRRDFWAITAELDHVRETVAKHQSAQVDAARSNIAEVAGNVEAVAQHRELLDQLVDDGEVAGALEYLEQLVTDGRLPDPHREDAHFRRFFPGIPALAAGNRTLLSQIREYFDTGTTHPDVTRLAEFAEVDLSTLSDNAKKMASRAIGTWGAGVQQNVTGVLRPILALAGYEFTDATITSPATQARSGRQWVRLSGVTAVGNALSPSLGSQMSAGGTSLRVLVVTKHTQPNTLAEWLRSERQEDTVLVLHLPGAYSEADRLALANVSRGKPRPVAVVFDTAVLAYLAVQPEPSRATFAAITLPFTADSPYRDRAGKTAPEMFYGRNYERREVVNLEGASFVSGGRQLGKSALLWSAKDEFEKDSRGDRCAVMLEIRAVGGHQDPDQLWPRLMSALSDADIVHGPPPATVTGPTVCAAIRKWLDEDTERRLLVLLDEADLFLEADAAGNRFANISLCKNLMDDTARRVKFVFAGLHRTARFESLPNQPLAHLGRPIVVGPLRPQAAHDLLTRPLSAHGFTFEDPRTQPARILAFTNNVPSLLQLFGQSLMRRLTSRDLAAGGPPTVITDDDITAVLEDTNLQDEFRRKYLLTLDLDNRYKVIVYAVAYNALENGVDNGVTLNQLEETCRFFWPEGFADVSLDHLRGLVTECCDLGVLAYDAEHSRYRMRTQTMLRLLGNLETIEETLTDAPARLTLPSTTDVESHRVALHGGSTNRSPLTSRQASQILTGAGRCFVIAGTSGLGVQWAAAGLDTLEHLGAARGLSFKRLSNATPEGMRAALTKANTPTVVIADLRKAPADRVVDLAASATELLRSCRTDVVVTIISDQAGLLAWHRVDNLVELSRVNAPGLRLWCEESDSPFLAPVAQQRLMAVTGGWPRNIAAAIAATGPNTSAADALDKLGADLATPDKAALFAVEAGLLPGTDGTGRDHAAVLLDAFHIVADLTSGGAEKPDELIAILEVADNPVGVSMSDAAVAVGFRDVEEVLLCLRSCGALTVDNGGNVAPEPVLLAAVQTARAGDGA